MSNFTEAPASINFKGITKSGWTIQVTLRDGDENNLMDRFGQLLKSLESWGVQPAEKPVVALPDHKPAAPPATTTKPVPAKPIDNMPVEETVFSAETLVANMNDGKVYWKVKGGQYGKYGVTVWPETLAEIGIDVNTLDPKETYNLDGYTAFVMLKDGKPSKVFRLVSKE